MPIIKDTLHSPISPSLLAKLPENAFQTICDLLPVVVGVYNINTGKYIYINKAIRTMLGYEPEQYLEGGIPFVASIVHPHDRPLLKLQSDQFLKNANTISSNHTGDEPVMSVEYRIKNSKGRYIWLHTERSVFRRRKGKVEYVLNVTFDITKHKKLENKFFQSATKAETAERFVLAHKAAKVGTFEWIPSSDTFIWSSELAELYGINKAPISTSYQEWLNIIHKDHRKIVEEEMKSTVKNSQPTYAEFKILKADGSYRWMLGRGELIKGSGKQPDRFIGANVDITDRKEIEERFRSSEQRYRAFIKNSSEGIWRMELEKPIPINSSVQQQIKHLYKYAYMAEANNAMAKMYDFKNVKDLIGLRWGDLWVGDDPMNINFLKSFIKSGYNLTNAESHELDLNGKDKYFLNNFFGIIEGDKLLRFWGTQQDITDQHYASEALKKSEERLTLALDASRLGIWEYDIVNNKLEWSLRLRKLFGLKPDEEITYEKYLSRIYPKDLPKLLENISASLKTGRGYQIEHRAIHPDGSIHWLLGQGRTLMIDGKPVRMIGTSINIDVRKKAEQLRVKMASLRAERKELIEINRTKDEFIALTSHQLRTPATGVKQYLGLLLENYTDPLTKGQKIFIEKAYENNERQLRIVDDLLHIARLDLDKVNLRKVESDLFEIVEDTIASLKGEFNKHKLKIDIKSTEKPFIANFDGEQLRMAIENILENAANYTREGKKVSVTLNKTKSGRTKIIVKDQGVGIAEKDFPKLFQKFSRISNPLSEGTNGTGLGLYYAKKIIELHGGSIIVNSKLNSGSTFTISLPK